MSCACCGTPTPAPERIHPLGIQYGLNNTVAIILWNCPGAREIDLDLLRFGILAHIPWSCRTTRAIPWQESTTDLRRRALLAEQLHYALHGLI